MSVTSRMSLAGRAKGPPSITYRLEAAWALALAATLVVWSSTGESTTAPEVATTGSVIGPRVAPLGGKPRHRDEADQNTTMIRSAVGGDLCISVRLMGQWTVERDGQRLHAIHVEDGADIQMIVLTDTDLAPSPETLTQRAASSLQDEYERLLGKPAQVVTLERVPTSPATRWTATWVDSNFPNEDRDLSLEVFIFEPLPNRVVEMTVSGGSERRDTIVQGALETLTIELAQAHRTCP
jgi:hypothetical protein